MTAINPGRAVTPGTPFMPGHRVLVGIHRRPGEVVTTVSSPAGVTYDLLLHPDCDNPAPQVALFQVPAGDVLRPDVRHPDHPDHGYGNHRRTVVAYDCVCTNLEHTGHGCVDGSVEVAECEDCGEEWPCDVVHAWRRGRASAAGPVGGRVILGGPGTRQRGRVVSVDTGAIEVLLDGTGNRTWTVLDPWVDEEPLSDDPAVLAAVVRWMTGSDSTSPGNEQVCEMAARDVLTLIEQACRSDRTDPADDNKESGS